MAAKKGAAASATPEPTDTLTPAASPVAARGDVVLVLDDFAYVLRPTFAAIGAIETATGTALFDLGIAAENRKLTYAEADIIVAECVMAQARATGDGQLTSIRRGRMGELIYASSGGLAVAVIVIARLLFFALTGGYTELGEVKRATTTI